MGLIEGIILRVVVWLCGTVIGRGVLRYLHSRGRSPDKWVQRMIGRAHESTPEGIGWILAGVFGLIILGLWEAVGVDNYLQRFSARTETPIVYQRHLTETQRNKLRTALLIFSQKVKTIAVYAGSGEDARYALDFAQVMKAANIAPMGVYPSAYPEFESERGLLVGLKDMDHPSDNAIQFMEALEAADLKPHRTKANSDVALFGNDFDLLIAAP